jgi:hypothetical protein
VERYLIVGAPALSGAANIRAAVTRVAVLGRPLPRRR